ncbi:hypothetical protein ACROYT_G005557 [Oculina patagonica]
MSFVEKACVYVRSDLEKFNDIYGDNMPAEQHMDPAFIEYIKGEKTVTRTENVDQKFTEALREEVSGIKVANYREHISYERVKKKKQDPPPLSLYVECCGTCVVIRAAENS